MYLPVFPGVGMFVVGALSDVYLYLQVLVCLMWALSTCIYLYFQVLVCLLWVLSLMFSCICRCWCV